MLSVWSVLFLTINSSNLFHAAPHYYTGMCTSTEWLSVKLAAKVLQVCTCKPPVHTKKTQYQKMSTDQFSPKKVNHQARFI